MNADEGVHVRKPGWTALAWLLGLSPHALPMASIIDSARTLSGSQVAIIQLMACYEVAIAVLQVVLASAFTGRLTWVRRILWTTAAIGAVIVVPVAIIAGLSGGPAS